MLEITLWENSKNNCLFNGKAHHKILTYKKQTFKNVLLIRCLQIIFA